MPFVTLVYGTGPDAGANRHAAEELRRRLVELVHYLEPPLRKDFEVSEAELKDRDVIFVGRPETNSALARMAARIGLRWEGEAFQLEGQTYASERNALWLVANHPLNPRRWVIVIAGNAALETVRAVALLAKDSLPDGEYTVLEAGKSIADGFLARAQKP
jgi:hypothetical protein